LDGAFLAEFEALEQYKELTDAKIERVEKRREELKSRAGHKLKPKGGNNQSPSLAPTCLSSLYRDWDCPAL
jgi:hypothetical protein